MYADLLASVSPWVLLVVGGFLLWWGGDKLVEHAAHLAHSFRVPKHVVGAVVLGFGTSLPELLVCLNATFDGSPGIASGNVIGSNIANVGLILGLAALLAPVTVEPKLKRLDLPLALVGAGVLAFLLFPNGGTLGRVPSIALLVVFAAYLGVSLVAARSHRRKTRDEVVPERHTGKDLLWVVIGLGGVALGADWFVEGAKGAALIFHVPDDVVGLSVVAIGTSLPELVTTVQSARQGHPELAVGNVAGSNVFNLFLVLGTTSTILPVEFSPGMSLGVVVMGVFALLAFPVFRRFQTITRVHGVMLLVLYAAYMGWLFVQGGVGAQ